MKGHGHSSGSHSGPSPYWLISLSFLVNRPSYSYITYRYFEIWIMGKVKVQGHKRSPTSYHCCPLHFMSMDPPILQIWLFQNLTLKIQVMVIVQGHIVVHHPTDISLSFYVNAENPRSRSWVSSSRLHSWSNILSLIPFVPCQSVPPFLRYSYFKTSPWKYKVIIMVKVQGHKVDMTSHRP